MSKPKIIHEIIPAKIKMTEVLSGTFEQIRQNLKDLEDQFSSLYDQLEIEHKTIHSYEYVEYNIYLKGLRTETPEEMTKRLEQEEQARIKRLKQLAKDRQTLEKKKQKLESDKKNIEKQLAQLGDAKS